jgi:two-component system, cell cycle sensor histidine kinase and response regulator CckA
MAFAVTAHYGPERRELSSYRILEWRLGWSPSMSESSHSPRSTYDPRDLLNAQPVIVSVIDPPTYRVQFQNETGLNKFGDISGQTCHEKIAGCPTPCSFCKMPEAVSTGKMTMNEVALPNNQWVLVQWSKATTAGGHTHVIETITDITERKRLEDSARRTEKMEALSRLAGGMAHDLTNLLTVITGASEQVSRQVEDREHAQVPIKQINDAVGRAAELMHNLVAFSHHQVVEPIVLDLNGILIEMKPIIQKLVGDTISLTVALAAEGGSVVMARQQIEDIIRNVVANARDAMPHGGQLKISTSLRTITDVAAQEHAVRPGSFVEMTVHDTGRGIDPEMQAHLFEPFFVREQFQRGRGLGLASLYGIVRQGGGFVEVSSKLGVGSVFRISLPWSDQVRSDCAPVRSEALDGGGTILLVEDDEDVRVAVRDMLRGTGYKVQEAADGIEALSLLGNGTVLPQLVLTDVMMPRMTGPQLAKRIDALMPTVKVLYMSGYANEILESVRGQPLAFIPKPFNSRDLLRKVRETLAG